MVLGSYGMKYIIRSHVLVAVEPTWIAGDEALHQLEITLSRVAGQG